MNKTLLATTAFALVAASASAVDVELYGQVNKGLFGYDDGNESDFAITDNDLSSTRFGFKGAQALDNGLTASVLFEGEMQSNPSNAFTQGAGGTAPVSNSPTFDERQARVGLSGNFGGVYLGQQSTAIDGARTQDLAGVGDVMSADYAKIGGGLVYAGTATSINTMGPLAADNREDSIRYDSPIFAGFQGRVSMAQGGDPELAALYDGAYGDFKIKAGLGYQANANNTSTPGVADTSERYDASVSVGHAMGLAGTLAYQTYEVTTTGRNPESWYAKVGYAWDAYEVAADYGTSDGFTAGEQDVMGLGAQYNLGNGVSAAVLYRNFDASGIGATDEVDLYGVNMRVKF